MKKAQCPIRAPEPGRKSNLKIITNKRDSLQRQLERYGYLADSHSVKYHFGG